MSIKKGLMKKLLAVLLVVIAIIFYFIFDQKTAAKQKLNTVNHAVETMREKNITYLVGYNGEYLKIDLNTKSIAGKGDLSELDGVKEYLPAHNNVGSLIFKARYDSTTNRIYLLTPHEIDLASSVTPDERKYQLLSVQLPSFKVSNQLVLNRKLGYPPSFLITSDGKKILVNYKEYSGEGENETVTSTLEFYASDSMKKLDEIVKVAYSQDVGSLKVYLNNAFGLDAEFQENDSIINDGFNSILVDVADRSMQKYPIISYDNFMSSYLTNLQRKQLNKYAVLHERTGKKHPKILRIGQHGNTIVTISYKDELPKGTLIISDRKTMKSKFFDVTFTPSLAQAYLTPDGKYILVESSELRKRDDGYGNIRENVFRTGDIYIYSTENGGLVNTVSDSPLKGFDVRNICTLKDDKNTTLYQVKDTVYLLEAVKGTHLHEIKGVFDVDVGGLRCM